MSFSYTVDAAPTTNTAAGDTMLRPNMALVSGTATGGADATGTIVTGLSDIIMFVIYNNEAKNESPKVSPNVTGAGAAQAGSIGVLAQADATNNTYIWYAIGVI